MVPGIDSARNIRIAGHISYRGCGAPAATEEVGWDQKMPPGRRTPAVSSHLANVANCDITLEACIDNSDYYHDKLLRT